MLNLDHKFRVLGRLGFPKLGSRFSTIEVDFDVNADVKYRSIDT